VASALHRQRLATVVEHLVSSGARSVLDLGCGEGELLQQLVKHGCFERLVGIDIDDRALDAARRALGLTMFPLQDERTQVRRGSFEHSDRDLCGFDAGVLLEVIEHVDPRRLACVERAVFGAMRPSTVLVTTPNQEYNILHDLGPGELRHPGHRFEWPRAKFRHWAGGVAARNGYRACFFDIGPVHPARGSTTQMARFLRRDTETTRATA